MKHKLAIPPGCPGCYTLDLYCDHVNDAHGFEEFPHQFIGETYGACAKQARKRGWILHRNGSTATCPKCSVDAP